MQSIFRILTDGNDVRSNLERNWIHFFWLTGETPVTLQNLVNCVKRDFCQSFLEGEKVKHQESGELLLIAPAITLTDRRAVPVMHYTCFCGHTYMYFTQCSNILNLLPNPI